MEDIINTGFNEHTEISEMETNQAKNMSVWAQLKHNFPLFLSHHPLCQRFSNHVLQIGSVKLCIGCFIGYPSAFIALFLGKSLIPHFNFPLYGYVLIGIFLMSSQFLSLSSITEKKQIKIIQKICMGLGGGMIVIAAYFYLGGHLSSPNKFYLMLIISILGIPVGLLHYRTMKRTCNLCVHKWDPEYCHIDLCLADINLYCTNK